jgi:hypothetical protein
MKRIAVVLVAVCWICLGQSAIPRFEDYPSTDAYKGQNAPIVLSKDDLNFRTKLRLAARQKPDFAGHFILTAWGCGAECVMGAVIDANSGRVYWFPHTICCWPDDADGKFRPIEYQLGSRLVIFSGARNEKDGDQGTHYYEFRDGRFMHIRSVMRGPAH